MSLKNFKSSAGLKEQPSKMDFQPDPEIEALPIWMRAKIVWLAPRIIAYEAKSKRKAK